MELEDDDAWVSAASLWLSESETKNLSGGGWTGDCLI